MKSFRERVYMAVAKIPRGRVATYGEIAKQAGSPRAARAVGTLMKKNTRTNTIPCHRVVAADGSLAGYAFGDIKAKRKRLLSEGVHFNENKAVLTVWADVGGNYA